MAILLVAVHVSPLPRTFAGFKPERGFSLPGGNLFDADAPDRRWLAFTRYLSMKPLSKGNLLVDSSGQPLNVASGFDNRTGNEWGAKTSDPGKPAATRSMPSFVIRYADRRQFGAGEAAVGAPSGPPPARPRGPAF